MIEQTTDETRVTWRCEDCGVTGEIDIENADPWLHIDKANRQHSALATDCGGHVPRIFPV